MKSILEFRKAILLAMCVVFSLTLFSGCSDDGDSKDPRDNYVGSYRVIEKLMGIEIDNYYVTIVKSSTSDNDILINNFFNMSSVSARVTVSGNSFTIPQQTYVDGGFSGSGQRDGNRLYYSVNVSITGEATYNIEVEATRQ